MGGGWGGGGGGGGGGGRVGGGEGEVRIGMCTSPDTKKSVAKA